MRAGSRARACKRVEGGGRAFTRQKKGAVGSARYDAKARVPAIVEAPGRHEAVFHAPGSVPRRRAGRAVRAARVYSRTSALAASHGLGAGAPGNAACGVRASRKLCPEPSSDTATMPGLGFKRQCFALNRIASPWCEQGTNCPPCLAMEGVYARWRAVGLILARVLERRRGRGAGWGIAC